MITRIVAVMLLTFGAIAQTSPDAEITALENEFFKAWQEKSMAAVESNIAPEGVAWSEWGIFDKAKQVENQKAANSNCTVRRWTFKDVRVMRVSSDSMMLLYMVDQDAVCGGSPAPSPVANSSLWTKRGGRWLNVYRASVFPKH